MLFQPLEIYMAGPNKKVLNSRNTKEKSEICPKLTINTVESSSGVLIIDFEDISHFFLVFLLMTLNR